MRASRQWRPPARPASTPLKPDRLATDTNEAGTTTPHCVHVVSWGGDAGDSALLSIFDSGGTLLGFYNLDSTSGVAFADLSSFGTLRSIIFDNVASTGAGYAYGDISYDPAAVPLPAALPLLLAGLGGIAALRARRAA